MNIELLNKSEHRQYQFLNELIIKRTLHYPFSDMQKLLNCSELTLRKDIKHLNFINNNPLFKSQRGDIIVLENSLNTINSLREYVLKNSEACKLLKSIFEKNFTNLSEAQTYLGLSESTLRRQISKINVVLKSYFVQLDSHSLQLKGNESTIRSWITWFIIHSSLIFDRETYLNRTQRIFDELFIPAIQPQMDSFFLSSYSIRMIIYSNLLRYKQGHYILDKNGNKPSIYTIFDDTNVSELLNEVDPLWHTREDSPEEVIYQLIYPFSDSLLCTDYHHIHNDEHQDSIQYFKQFIQKVQVQFNIQIDQPNNLIQNLINTHYYFTHEMFVPYFSQDIVDHMAIMFPYFNRFFEIYLKKHPIPGISTQDLPFYTETIINCFILYCSDLYPKLCQSIGTMKVLLIPRYSYSQAQWLKEYIMMDTTRHISIDISYKKSLNFSREELNTYDVIISQIVSSYIDHPRVIQIGSNWERENLLQLISNLQQVKRQQQKERHSHGIILNL